MSRESLKLIINRKRHSVMLLSSLVDCPPLRMGKMGTRAGRPNKTTVQQVGLAYGPIRACSYSYTAQAAGPQRSPRKASLTPGSADAMREKSMFAAYIAASVGHS